MNIQLESGRVVRVYSAFAFETYEGWTGGPPNQAMNRQLIRDCERRASKVLGNQFPWVVPRPPEEERDGGSWLPRWCCGAELQSSPLNSSEDARYSVLCLLWFVSSEEMETRSLAEQVGEALRRVRWERRAEDCESC